MKKSHILVTVETAFMKEKCLEVIKAELKSCSAQERLCLGLFSDVMEERAKTEFSSPYSP